MTTTTATKAPISFTEKALKEVKIIMSDKSVPSEYGLRVGIQGGGCSGMSYMLGFDKVTDNGETFEVDDVTLIMDKKHGMYVMGMEVDFKDGLDARGFIFNNPNAEETCGCGDSFSV